MDLNKNMLFLIFLVVCGRCVSGLRLPRPENLQVNILEGEVIVHWDKPVDAPSDVQYNVEFGRHAGEWTLVRSCMKITKTFCNLSNLIQDYYIGYKVRVQLVAGDVHSEWTLKKKFLPNSGDLQPPSFTLWATSSSLTVYVHQKAILRKLFSYGIIYTIYLEEKEQNKSTLGYLKEDIWEDQQTKTFSSLCWGKEYCVSVRVEGNGGLASSLSPQQCLVLPEQEWIITAVTSLTVLGLLTITAFIAGFIVCCLKRSGKTPAALKSLSTGWRPLSIREASMEVVTDKGWFLSRLEAVSKDLPSTFIAEEDRRPSTHSSVSTKSTLDTTHRQDDSGFGSIGGQESMCGHYPIHEAGSNTYSKRKMDDSGVGLGCHSDTSSLNLEEQDSGCSSKSEDSYHRQHLSSMHSDVCDNQDVFKEKLPETQLVSVVTGYRANTSFCTCSEAGQCIWCHNQGNYKGQYKLQNCNTVDSYRKKSYSTHDQMDMVMVMDSLEIPSNVTFVKLGETFPMLTALSSFPFDEGQDFNMNDVTISLCDAE